MCNSWNNALEIYNWTVDLRKFNKAGNYPEYFNRIIHSNEVIQFEHTFREHVDDNSSFQIAGEVCFWKNYGSHLSRNKLTESLLRHLANITSWDRFVVATKEISVNPIVSSIFRTFIGNPNPVFPFRLRSL